MPNWEEIRKEWETTKITLAALADKHGIKLGTLKSRKSREEWSRDATKKDATKTGKVATPNQKDATEQKEQFEPIVEGDNLTDKQRLFCIYYIKYFNATKAYQKAYECAYSTAMVEGHRILRNPKINTEIDRLKAEQTNELKLDVRDVLQKYIDIAFADIGDYVDIGGDGLFVKVKPMEEMDTSIISELSNNDNGIKLKLPDKMKALEVLSKYFDMLSDRDKEQLEREKLKVEIAKTKAETEKISKEDEGGAPPTITIVDAWSDDDE
ncbi:terminase small subunit [Siminovitchia terrae]|uniref:terminase small subunit n=1 Tax=Siminovitchia terrae TaxID=1914933 RepID=UPI0028AD9BA1|nr:terminase small subunit [Siminovitchia terrae]